MITENNVGSCNVCQLSTKFTTFSFTPPKRAASKTMVQATHWLCRTLPGTNISDRHRFTLEMARGTPSQSCYLQ